MAHDGHLQITARRYVEELRGDVASSKNLQAMARATDFDSAAMLYYESLLNSRRDADFIRAVSAIKSDAVTSEQRQVHHDIEILIVPSVFSLVSRWESVGGEQTEALRARLRVLGFKTDVAPTDPGAALDENAQKIGRAVIQSSASKVILVSRGRGSLEVRLLFHALKSGGFDLEKIVGWISVSAQLKGVRAFDLDFADGTLFGIGQSVRRLKLEAGARLAKESVEAVRAAAASKPPWRAKIPLPERVSFVQIVGVPKRENLNFDLRARFDAMKELGPSDGLQLLSDAHSDVGLVVPVWGLSPSASLNQTGALIERVAMMIAGVPAALSAQLPLQNVAEDQRRHDRGV